MHTAEIKLRLAVLGVPDNIYDHYREPHRYYHTLTHLDDLFRQIKQRGLVGDDAILLAAVYHDVIYDPQSSTNEEDSARYFNETFKGDKALKKEVTGIILDTKTHEALTARSRIFCDMDLGILRRPLGELIDYEHQIFKEFQFVDYKVYQAKRIEVLRSLQQHVDNPHLDALITYVAKRQPKIGVYPGSFNPFHKGHYNILQKAEKVFDKVIIARGINPSKNAAEYELPAILKHRQQALYEGLMTDFVKQLGYPVTVIRGLRNGTDLQAELNQYRYLQDLSGNDINIISIFCDREFEHISSTGIRQLAGYGKAGEYLL